MILQIHITDAELIHFYRRLGIEAKMKEVTEYRSAYHNQIKEIQRDIPVVEMNGQKQAAHAVFERYVKNRLLSPATEDYSLIRNLL